LLPKQTERSDNNPDDGVLLENVGNSDIVTSDGTDQQDASISIKGDYIIDKELFIDTFFNYCYIYLNKISYVYLAAGYIPLADDVLGWAFITGDFLKTRLENKLTNLQTLIKDYIKNNNEIGNNLQNYINNYYNDKELDENPLYDSSIDSGLDNLEKDMPPAEQEGYLTEQDDSSAKPASGGSKRKTKTKRKIKRKRKTKRKI
jgi:hypothetical protein